MIGPQNLNINNYLMLYAKSQSTSAITYMYGQYLTNNSIYDIYDINSLNESIPNNLSTYNTEGNEINYILLPPSDNKNYFYLNVLSNSPEMIELIPNYYNDYEGFIPNPNLNQIFVLNSTLKSEMNLNFISRNAIMIKAVSLKGEGEIYLNNQKVFNLNKENNRILITLPSDIDDKIKIKNRRNENNQNFFFYFK